MAAASLDDFYYLPLSPVNTSCRTFVISGDVPMQLPPGERMRCQVKHM